MSYMSLAYTLMAGIIPACIWLVFWLREDVLQPEPRWLIAACFVGGAVSVIAAIFAERYVADIASDQTLRYTLWAAIEEIVKLVAVAVIALNSTYNDEPIDAMIYIITVALGFSAVENALFIVTPLSHGDIAQSIATNSMRFVGASLVHIVSSALIGFAWGYTLYREPIVRGLALFMGIVSAIGLHAAFNLSVIGSAPTGILKTFAMIWAAVVLIIVLFEEVKVVKPKNRYSS